MDVVDRAGGMDAVDNQPSSIIKSPGIYPGLSFAEYRVIPAVNNGLLWTLKTRSPAHAKYELDNPPKDTPALVTGRAIHSLLLEPAAWDKYYAVRPVCDGRTREGKAILDDFRQQAGAREVIKAEDYEIVRQVERSVRSQQCRELICSGRAEVVIVWVDEKTGLLCKARLDYERSDGWNHYIPDVKSTVNASREAFERDIAAYGYYMQAAYYCWGWQVLTGEESVWAWLAVEKDPPYVAKVWEPAWKTMKAGRKAYRAALDTWAECVEKNEYPAYGGPELIEMRDWALALEGVGQFDMEE